MLPLLGLAGLCCGCGASRPPTLSILARPGHRVVKLRLPLRHALATGSGSPAPDGSAAASVPEVVLERLCKTPGEARCVVRRLCPSGRWCA